jgi:hypothetical protein
MSRLLDERYYPDVSKAVNSKNEKLWLQTCEKAGIPDEASTNLWKIINAHGITYADLWMIAEPQIKPPVKKPIKKADV